MIENDDIENLPDDPEAAFVHLFEVCKRTYDAHIRSLREDDDASEIRLEFMGQVQAAAEELGIDGAENLFIPDANDYNYSHYREFAQRAIQLVTRLKIRALRRARSQSVALAEPEKLRLEHEIAQLRKRVEESDLDEALKRKIGIKLDELVNELGKKRVNFAAVMVIVAGLATAVEKGQSIIIKLPETIEAVAKVIGMAMDTEDAQRPALPPPVKAIEHKKAREDFSADLDDEIPF